jgi:hypothetical protein
MWAAKGVDSVNRLEFDAQFSRLVVPWAMEKMPARVGASPAGVRSFDRESIAAVIAPGNFVGLKPLDIGPFLSMIGSSCGFPACFTITACAEPSTGPVC